MFNFGFSELIVIAGLALIFIGPKQLPEVARVVGRLLNEFKRATGDITSSFVSARDEADEMLRKTKQKISDEINESVGDIGPQLLEGTSKEESAKKEDS